MKKSLLALALLGAFAGVASAQSSVTLFGIVDMSARSSNNGNVTQKTLSTDGLNSNRLGFRGTEDLGGGFGAGFWLEAGLSPDIGTAGGGNTVGAAPGSSNGAAFFNRRATVSLTGRFGEVRLGRDYIPTFWNLTVFDPFGTNGVGAYTNIVPGQGAGPLLGSNIVRANNSIAYFLPAMGGLYGQFTVAAGEGTPTAGTAATSAVTLPTPASNGNKYTGGRVGFAAGPVNVAVAVGQREVAPVAGQDKMKSVNFAGSYAIGPVKPMVQYGTFKLGNNTLKTFLVGATATLGQGEVRFAYSKLKNDTVASDDVKQIALGYIYNLSTRTALYGTYSRLTNDPGVALGTTVGGLAAVAGKTYTGYEAGLRHSF